MRHYHLVFAELADGVSHASAHDDDDALACRHGEGGEFAFEDDGIAGPDRRATSCTTGSGRSARSRTPTKVRTTVRSRR
jgi:hypothetical protein